MSILATCGCIGGEDSPPCDWVSAPSYYQVATGTTAVSLNGRTLFAQPERVFALDGANHVTVSACGQDAENHEWSIRAWAPMQRRVVTEPATFEATMLEEGIFYLARCNEPPCAGSSVGYLLYESSRIGSEPPDSLRVTVHPSDLDAGQFHMELHMEENDHLLEAEFDLTWEVP